MSRRFLFALTAFGGNVPPQLVLARRLVDRGHAVHVLAPSVLRGQVEAAGAVYEPYRETPEHDESDPATSVIRDFEARTPIGMVRAVRDRVLVGFARPVYEDTMDLVGRMGFDVIAPDYFLLGAMLAAEKTQLPYAPLIHTCYPFPAPGLPPFGSGLAPSQGPLGRLRDQLGQRAFLRLLIEPAGPDLNAIRADIGLPALTSPMEVYGRADRLVVLTSRAFDFPAALPENVVYVGPQLQDVDEAPPWEPPWPRRRNGPLVLVSLSTTYQAHEAMLGRIVEAMGRLPAWTIVCSGRVRLDLPRLPANVHVTPFVPHARVIPTASLVITHAGHGTAITALAHGVPLVCLPIGRDQPDVAARVVAHGAGVRMRRGSHSEAINRAARHVLATPAYRDQARRLAAEIATENPHSAGADELERLADRAALRRPGPEAGSRRAPDAVPLRV